LKTERTTIKIVMIVMAALFLCKLGQSHQDEIEQEGAGFIEFFSEAVSNQRDGNFQAAMKYFNKALAISKKYRLAKEEAHCLSMMGIIAWDLGQIERAENYFISAHSRSRDCGASSREEFCSKALIVIKLYARGTELRRSSKSKESLEYFNRAIELSREINIEDFQLKCLRQKSLGHWEEQDLLNYLDCNKGALALAYKLRHEVEIGRCLNNIGLYHEKKRDYLSALKYLEEARIILGKSGDQESEAECLTNIGIAYGEVGDYDKALSSLNEALRLDRNSGAQNSIFKDLVNLGSLHLKEGLHNNNQREFRSALENLKECGLLRLAGVNRQDEQALINNTGIAFYGLHKYEEALESYHRALNYSDYEGRREICGIIYCNIGDAHLALGNIEEAIQAFKYSISLTSGVNNSCENWGAFFGLGQCFEEKGVLVEALSYYFKSMEIIEKIRKQIGFDMFKVGFVRNKMQVYDRALELLLRLYSRNPSEVILDGIFLTVERAKARALLDILAGVGLALPEIANPQRSQIIKRREGNPSLILINLLSELKNSLSQIEKERAETIPNDDRVVFSPSDQFSAEVCTVGQAKEGLLDDEHAILQYWLGNERSFVICVTRSRTKLVLLKSKEKIERSLRGFIKALACSPINAHFNGYRAALRIAKEILPIDDEKFWSDIRHLIVLPHGVLHYLPFEALRTIRSGSTGYVIEHYEISYSPSASTLLALEKPSAKHRPPKHLLAFGVPQYDRQLHQNKGREGIGERWRDIYKGGEFQFKPLQYSTEEIKDIASYFAQQTRDVYIGEDANEGLVKRLDLEKYQIIHFACHGVVEDGIPFHSALLLSPERSPSEDGLLQAREIRELRTHADLIVLSACQTARGELEGAEGLMGLPWIFFSTGAQSVLASLWAVNDQSTALFMKEFYKSLFIGNDKSSALRAAKMKMLGSRFAHPFYWASFVLSGDTSFIELGSAEKGHNFP